MPPRPQVAAVVEVEAAAEAVEAVEAVEAEAGPQVAGYGGASCPWAAYLVGPSVDLKRSTLMKPEH